MPIKNSAILNIVVAFSALSSLTNAYSSSSHRAHVQAVSSNVESKVASPPTSTVAGAAADISGPAKRPASPLSFVQKGISTLALTAAFTLSSTTVLPSIPAHAGSLDYESMAEDTIEIVLQDLKDATGDTAKSFKVFESINDIITEGKGVGGSLSYTGVKLERGYVADEDTTIYNPGLSLLTESEKTSLVNAVIANRKGNLASNTWSEDNEYAFEFLKTRLDPLHMVELKGYLKFLPFLGGAMYLVALGVQQFARGLFEVAYIVSALVVFIPIFIFIAVGP